MISIVKPSKISKKILSSILLFSLLISLFSVGAQLYFDFERDIELLEESMQKALDTSLEPIKNAVWEYKEPQLEYQLQGLVKQAFVVGAKINYGENFNQEMIVGDAQSSNTKVKHADISTTLFEQHIPLAKISIYGDIEAVYDKTKQRLWTILLAQGIKTFLVSIFILYLIKRVVLDRILKMESWSQDNTKSKSPLTLDTLNNKTSTNPTSENDEIDFLASRLNEMASSLHDYSENLEEQVKRRTEELETAKLMAEHATKAKSDFLSNMSHEIRTPMNAVIGLSQLALKTELSAQQRDYLDKILNSADGLLGLINDILDFSKIESGSLTIESVSFELDKVVQRAVNVVSLKGQDKGLEIVTYISPEVPNFLKGDPLRLQQILTNLCSNAVKFTDSGIISVVLTSEPCK